MKAFAKHQSDDLSLESTKWDPVSCTISRGYFVLESSVRLANDCRWACSGFEPGQQGTEWSLMQASTNIISKTRSINSLKASSLAGCEHLLVDHQQISQHSPVSVMCLQSTPLCIPFTEVCCTEEVMKALSLFASFSCCILQRPPKSLHVQLQSWPKLPAILHLGRLEQGP